MLMDHEPVQFSGGTFWPYALWRVICGSGGVILYLQTFQLSIYWQSLWQLALSVYGFSYVLFMSVLILAIREIIKVLYPYLSMKII